MRPWHMYPLILGFFRRVPNLFTVKSRLSQIFWSLGGSPFLTVILTVKLVRLVMTTGAPSMLLNQWYMRSCGTTTSKHIKDIILEKYFATEVCVYIVANWASYWACWLSRLVNYFPIFAPTSPTTMMIMLLKMTMMMITMLTMMLTRVKMMMLTMKVMMMLIIT